MDEVGGLDPPWGPGGDPSGPGRRAVYLERVQPSGWIAVYLDTVGGLHPPGGPARGYHIQSITMLTPGGWLTSVLSNVGKGGPESGSPVSFATLGGKGGGGGKAHPGTPEGGALTPTPAPSPPGGGSPVSFATFPPLPNVAKDTGEPLSGPPLPHIGKDTGEPPPGVSMVTQRSKSALF